MHQDRSSSSSREAAPEIATLGALRASGWQSVSVKAEVRRNAIARLRSGEPLVDGLVGFEDTVLPQLANALIAGHDTILLGERGQAKSRIVRALVGLLDPWIPVIADTELRDDPYAPISPTAQQLVSEHGEDTPIEWISRDQRYAEKLATPDTSIADLIGEVDPIKVAEGRHLSDPGVLHFGLVPRSNRGIFAMNELPDLSERIQVGLLNVLEERDVQLRGFVVRLPIDVLLIATANPDDYTNRGRLITPLKDRFGAQIRTHYPLDVDSEVAIVDQEASVAGADGVEVEVPGHMKTIIATISQNARRHPEVSQRSGVSVRLSIANLEGVVANAVRRALLSGDEAAAPRVSDLAAIAATTTGKIEVESFEEDREGHIMSQLINASVLETFRDVVPSEGLTAVVSEVGARGEVIVGEQLSAEEFVALLKDMPELSKVSNSVAGAGASDAELASAAELVLEGLHLSRRLNRDRSQSISSYTARAQR